MFFWHNGFERHKDHFMAPADSMPSPSSSKNSAVFFSVLSGTGTPASASGQLKHGKQGHVNLPLIEATGFSQSHSAVPASATTACRPRSLRT